MPGLEFAYLLLTAVVTHVNIESAFDGDVESVSTPLTLAHDLFAAVVSEQAHVGSHALTVAVITSLNDHFEIAGVLLLAVFFFEEFSGKSEILDGFNDATPVGDFARHVVVYTTGASSKPRILRLMSYSS